MSTSPKSLNIGCGEFPAPEPWVNVDVFHGEHVNPDVVVKGMCLPFSDGAFGSVYCGHVLEHIAWEAVPTLLAEIRRVARPGAWLCVVGPDVLRTIQRWRDGQEAWGQVLDYLEDDRGHGNNTGSGARHRWNCCEGRLRRLFDDAGLHDMAPLPIDSQVLDNWPVVSRAQHQCAFVGRLP